MKFTDDKILGYRWSDGPTSKLTDGRTQPLLEMRGRILKRKSAKYSVLLYLARTKVLIGHEVGAFPRMAFLCRGDERPKKFLSPEAAGTSGI